MHTARRLLGVCLISAIASAQQDLDVLPCSTMQDAGTLELVSGVLTPPSGVQYVVTEGVIYDNTCTTGVYSPLLNGNTLIDEGRLPSTTSLAPDVGAFNKYRVTKFRIGYCTRELETALGGPGASITVKFYESYTSCTPSTANPPPVATFVLTGLPASATAGTLACWSLNIDLTGGFEFYMLADADGVYNGTDLFGYSYEFPGQTGTTTSTVGGPSMRGNLQGSGCVAGSATYFHDPTASSGTGLDNLNQYYREGTNTGKNVNGCYFIGNPPSTHGGFYMKLWGDLDDCNANANPDIDDIAAGTSLDLNGNNVPDECEAPPVTSYCTSGTTTNGCVAVMAATGTASVSATSGFVLSASSVEGQKQGLIFYGVDNTGFTPLPWASGSTSFLCVKPPTQRTPAALSGGTTGACDGALSVDWLAYLASNPGALGAPFGAGQTVYAQAWFRDPPAAKTTSLSDALQFVTQP